MIKFLLSPVWLALFLVSRVAAATGEGAFEFKDCYAKWDAAELTVGNSRFEESWELKNGRLAAVSLRSKGAGEDWLMESKKSPSKGKFALQVKASTGAPNVVQVESLQLEVTIIGGTNCAEKLRVFPDTPGILMRRCGVSVPSADRPANSVAATGVEDESVREADGTNAAEALETFSLRPEHLRLIQVNFTDETDHHNELAYEREWLLHPTEERLALSGNLIFMEDALSGSGVGFLKLAPLPHARPIKTDTDFSVKARARWVQVAATDYPVAIFTYEGGRPGRIAALQKFQRQLRPCEPARDGVFLSNTWGDRARDSRISEAFVSQEIEAGAKLGVDVVQIDDGWQSGRTKNSAQKGGVWDGWWTANPNFWKVDASRFPHGLAPLIAQAREHHMQIGLWYAPDSSNDGANWEKDAARMLELHQLGINYFKIDSLKEPTLASAANHKRMFDRALRESGGKVVFDLDVTAGIRPGYFGLPEIGPLFLENRYTDWHNYWPHDTLRNLWNLAQYVDPNRLRVEFLNNTRNLEQYEKDPLAPGSYPPDTLFAITMIANPLGWFEVSSLPKDYRDKVAPLVAAWKRERARIHSAATIPIGSLPDGVAWTGFASVLEGGQGGYVLLFREMNQSPEFRLNLAGLFSGDLAVRILGGQGSAQIDEGQLNAQIPNERAYLWLRIESIQSSGTIGSSAKNDVSPALAPGD
jgi:alpha-galactosidase